MAHLPIRPRRNRKSEAIRSMVQETRLQPANLVWPVFVVAGTGMRVPVGSMPGCFRMSRDVLVKGLHEAGWRVDVPKASMYVWAKIPEPYAKMGSLEFAKHVLAKAKVSVSPGIGFGEFGDGHVRFAMIENEPRTRQAIRGIKQMFREDGLL